MNREDLFESIGHTDDALLEKCEKKKSRRPVWFSAVAALLAVVLGLGIFFRPQVALEVQAVAVAQYPEAVPYPEDPSDDKSYEAWWEYNRNHAPEPGYADNLNAFFRAGIREFLSRGEGNVLCSPLNTYLALSMLAELTGGETRREVLEVLGAENMETLRQQASTLWNAQYKNDGATTSILASSLWLGENVPYNRATLKTLAENYYATSYTGKMGSSEMDQALQDWINSQTGNQLAEQASSLHLTPETLLALAATIDFHAKWLDEFNPQATAPGTFHTPDGDVTADFMHASRTASYYWGEGFGAVGLDLNNGAGTMWLILPDEGVTPEALIQQDNVLDFLSQGHRWQDQEYLIVNMAVPKFDVTSDLSLNDGLKALGVTQVFDPETADFGPALTEDMGMYLSETRQAVRVSIDEEGVDAAAYTVMMMAGSGRPPEKTVDFTLDRPFLFAVTSGDQLPLFAGIVENP